MADEVIEIAIGIAGLTPPKRLPSDPVERRKTFNRWEDKLDVDPTLQIAAQRGDTRRAALAALRTLREAWVPIEGATSGDITRLEVQARAVQDARDAGLPIGLEAAASYCERVTHRVAGLRKDLEADTPILRDEDGTYDVDNIRYKARPVDVNWITHREDGQEPDCLYDGNAYNCGCSVCVTYRSRAQWLGSPARNRPQPWHPRVGHRHGPLLAVEAESLHPLALQEAEREITNHDRWAPAARRSPMKQPWRGEKSGSSRAVQEDFFRRRDESIKRRSVTESSTDPFEIADAGAPMEFMVCAIDDHISKAA